MSEQFKFTALYIFVNFEVYLPSIFIIVVEGGRQLRRDVTPHQRYSTFLTYSKRDLEGVELQFRRVRYELESTNVESNKQKICLKDTETESGTEKKMRR